MPASWMVRMRSRIVVVAGKVHTSDCDRTDDW
jgi:hypothetical protein